MVMYLGQNRKPEYYTLSEIGKDDGQSEVTIKLKAIPDDGIADGGEPYTDEELEIINK